LARSAGKAARKAPPGISGKVLVDSGPLLALFNAADKWHARVLEWVRLNESARLVTTWPVMTEVCALLSRRVGNPAALDFLRWVQRGGVEIDAPGENTLTEVVAISERVADLPLDLADASIAEAASRLLIHQVLTIDADFDIYRDGAGKALSIVLRA
jgi:uncharacterized protein